MCHGKLLTSGPLYDPNEEEFVHLPTGSGMLYASLFPARISQRGTVLLVSDVFGRTPFYRMLGHRLAGMGYRTLVPELFSASFPVANGDMEATFDRLGQLDQTKSLDQLGVCLSTLHEQDAAGHVVTIGFCLGGTLAMMLTARHSFAGAVIYYGFPARKPATEKAPYIVLDHLDDIGRHQVPVLGFWGDQEERVPLDTVAAYRDGLNSKGVRADIQLCPGVRHAFLTFDPDNPDYQVAQRSWDQTHQFLESTIRPAG
jgi:carboxymethylenebutenolidase